MQLKKYIKGDRHGKTANRLEREAMNDPFLQDALDGFDTVPGDHTKVIERLKHKVAITSLYPISAASPASYRNRGKIAYWSAAATILLIIGLGTYFLLQRNDPGKSAIVMLQTKEEEIEITPGFPVLLSEPVTESETDAQTMDKLTESENAKQAALVPEVTIQQASTQDARAIVPATEQIESRIAASSTPSQSLVDVQRAENKMVNSRFLVGVTEEEAEEDASSDLLFFLLDTVKDIDLSDMNRNMTLKEDSQQLEEVVVIAYGAKKKNILKRAISSLKEKRNDTTENSVARIESNTKFGEKEFQEYCRQKAVKNACDDKKVTVRVSFFIDASGKPTQIKHERFTCEKAKEEIELLLSASPVWTNINRKVTMTIRW